MKRWSMPCARACWPRHWRSPRPTSRKRCRPLRAQKYDQGWAGVMSGGGVHFDAKGLNTMAQPVMVQWQNNELVSVAQALAKGRVISAG